MPLDTIDNVENEIELGESDEEKLKALKRERTNIRGHLTRFRTFLNKFKSTNSTELEKRFRDFEPLLAEFRVKQAGIESLDPSEFAKSDETFATFENDYYELCSQAEQIFAGQCVKHVADVDQQSIVPETPPEVDEISSQIANDPMILNSVNTQQDLRTDNTSIIQTPRILNNLNTQQDLRINSNQDPQIIQPETVRFCNNSNLQNPTQTQTVIPQVPLPTITLQSFSGIIDEWLPFKDSFNSLIVTNTALTNCQRFFYLKSCLKGEALEVIKNIPLTESNYQIAWQSLMQRYENLNLIISNHVNNIIDIRKIDQATAEGLRLISTRLTQELRALQALGQPVQYWDTLVIHLMVRRLDGETRLEWERFKTTLSCITVDHFIKLLSNKAQLLEQMNYKVSKPSQQTVRPSFNNYKRTVSHTVTANNGCPFCKENHLIFYCRQFLKLIPVIRLESVHKLGLCVNCLKTNHKFCPSLSTCRVCRQRHNTILHDAFHKENPQQRTTKESASADHNKITTIAQVHSIPTCETEPSPTTLHSNIQTNVLLSTAVVDIIDQDNTLKPIRVLLDQGSQINLISEDACIHFGLPTTPCSVSVIGINNQRSSARQQTKITLRSKYENYSCEIACLVVDKISQHLPTFQVDLDKMTIPEYVNLADPEFYVSRPIDVLVGAQVFYEMLCSGQIRMGNRKPILQQTRLGWLISGLAPSLNTNRHIAKTFHSSVECKCELPDLTKFWELEEVSKCDPILSIEENQAEEHFSRTVERNEEGRYIVQLPFKSNIQLLGSSRESILKAFYALERRLHANPTLCKLYIDFMQEYIKLGHMSLVDEQTYVGKTFYMPHHGVLKDSSTTTRLRVVFNGSHKTSTNISLNDTLMVGPTIQQTLFSTLLRFRQHQVAFTADVKMMYRQIRVAPDDCKFQRIFWRSHPTQPLQCFQLNTVTYGTASAPFLAIRTLFHLAEGYSNKYPTASKHILNDFYVDDLLTGAESIHEAQTLKQQISTILNSAGLQLHKWRSNEPSLLPSEDNEYIIDHDNTVKTLGLAWNPCTDKFHFTVNKIDQPSKITKRQLLSLISKIFDPLGFLGPFITLLKLIMRELWQTKLNWDDEIPTTILSNWQELAEEIPSVNNVTIPRFVLTNNIKHVSLHGFSDASTVAFGAVLYIRAVDCSGNISVKLLCSKSRIAPTKVVTIPRLELCAALLLCHLVNSVKKSITFEINEVFLWCDSTIVLSWMAIEPAKLNVFVGNRISEIQSFNLNASWRHVKGTENPADSLSRGFRPRDLLECTLWWTGPSWLSKRQDVWPEATPFDLSLTDIPELRKPQLSALINTTPQSTLDIDIFHRYSSLTKLCRVLAYCFRFVHNSRNKINGSNRSGMLSNFEINKATLRLVKLAQKEFHQELIMLKGSKPLNKNNRLLALNPFVDKDSIIRVGGRLNNSFLPYDQKHPMILPSRHPFTNLVINHYHLKTLHSGVDTVLAAIRTKFWPISGRNSVKKTIHNCVSCTKLRGKQSQPIMADLPLSRLRHSKPFTTCGVDYAGPFLIKIGVRKAAPRKAYLCLFICFVTKAVHLEVVSDLTTSAFIAALRRMIARRGQISHIYSDNGSNFVGANRELKQFLNSTSNRTDIGSFATQNEIQWHFIPPYTPHFGGLWESNIKTAKRLLYSMNRDHILTFEELTTLFAQIESCMNSRPLYPMSNDPKDLSPLTPAHFLIGDSNFACPQEDLIDTSDNRLIRWQHVQKRMQQFWKRWSEQYIHTLQRRNKWQRTSDIQLKNGDLVLIKQQSTLPFKWPLGRIEKLHPSSDGIARIASIFTGGNTIQRTVNNLVKLPLPEAPTSLKPATLQDPESTQGSESAFEDDASRRRHGRIRT